MRSDLQILLAAIGFAFGALGFLGRFDRFLETPGLPKVKRLLRNPWVFGACYFASLLALSAVGAYRLAPLVIAAQTYDAERADLVRLRLEGVHIRERGIAAKTPDDVAVFVRESNLWEQKTSAAISKISKVDGAEFLTINKVGGPVIQVQNPVTANQNPELGWHDWRITVLERDLERYAAHYDK